MRLASKIDKHLRVTIDTCGTCDQCWDQCDRIMRLLRSNRCDPCWKSNIETRLIERRKDPKIQRSRGGMIKRSNKTERQTRAERMRSMRWTLTIVAINPCSGLQSILSIKSTNQPNERLIPFPAGQKIIFPYKLLAKVTD